MISKLLPAVRVVSLSGGMDSTATLARAVGAGADVLAVAFRYGSKHNKYELVAATRVAAWYGVPLRTVDLSGAFEGIRSDLLSSGGDVPEGHYAEESMRRTVVPGRNLIFISVLAGIAWSRLAELTEGTPADEDTPRAEVWLGVHAGDHHIYPDCRPSFISFATSTVRAGTDGRVRLKAPFLYGSKADIVSFGNGAGAPFNLTRTCYKDQPVACGRCGSCVERRLAFATFNADDPIEYEYTGPLPTPPAK